MVLKFNFFGDYSNGVVERSCLKIAKEMGLKLYFFNFLDRLEVAVKGKVEQLEEFATRIGNELPFSIFIDRAKVELEKTENLEKLSHSYLKNSLPPKVSLPPCPSCLREVTDPASPNYFNPFYHCFLCGYRTGVNPLQPIRPISNPVSPTSTQNITPVSTLNNPISNLTSDFSSHPSLSNSSHSFKPIGWSYNREVIGEVDSFPTLFSRLVEILKKEGEITIQTMTGSYRLSTNLKDASVLVVSDLKGIGTYFLLSEGELKRLGAIEKPLLFLRTSITFKRKFNLSTDGFWVKLPDDLWLELLFRKGKFPLLALFPAPKEECLISFSVKVEQPPMGVVSDTNSNKFILVGGERGIFPHRFPIPVTGIGEVGGYRAIGDGKWVTIFPTHFQKGTYREKKLLSTDNSLPATNKQFPIFTEFTANDYDQLTTSTFRKKSPIQSDRTSGGRITEVPKTLPSSISRPVASFLGTIRSWELHRKSVVGYLLYKREKSEIIINSPKTGFVSYLEFPVQFQSGRELLTQIAQMDSTGSRLVENFASKFPDLFQQIGNSSLNGNIGGLYYLWGVVGVVLGIGKGVEDGAKKIVQLANLSLAKKGPRIDYRVEGQKLDPLWVIRTAISFKIGGASSDLIAYGVLESGAEFLGNLYDTLYQDSPLDGAVLVGDLLEGIFLKKLYSNIGKNYPVFTPKGMAIGEGIEAITPLILSE